MIKIEKHNAHGLELSITMATSEAAELLVLLAKIMAGAVKTSVSHYTEVVTLFEDDNDKWEMTKLIVTVEGVGDAYVKVS